MLSEQVTWGRDASLSSEVTNMENAAGTSKRMKDKSKEVLANIRSNHGLFGCN